MLNPSGAKIFLYPLTYAFDETSPYRGLAEWLSPFKRGGITSPLFFYLMWMPAVGLLYALPAVRRRLDVPWEGIALTGLTLAMALTSRRFIPLFGISLAVMVAPLLGLGLRWLRVEKASLVLAIIALLYALFRLLPYPMQSGPAFHYLTAEYDFPVETLNFIEANNISGNTYAFYNWGGYIHWRTDGALKVFIDGRADTIYDGETYNQYLTVLGTRPGWLELMEANGTDYILWPHFRGDGQQKLRELVATGRWRAVYSDAVSWLLARKDTVPETEMLPSPPGPWRDIAIARISDWSGNADNAIEYAEKVREAMPWHKDACGLLIASFRSRGEPARADEILFDCRTYFPTRYLR
jgi:hypothetical protein